MAGGSVNLHNGMILGNVFGSSEGRRPTRRGIHGQQDLEESPSPHGC
jgi:hypothetical protein